MNRFSTFVFFILVTGVIAVAFLVILASCNPPSSMTRAQNKESQSIHANEWTACDFGYYSMGSGVEFIEGDSFVIDKKYSSAMLTINVEVEGERFVSIRITGSGDYPLEQLLVSADRLGVALYPIQNVNDFYTVELYSPEDTIIDLCRISIVPYK